MPFLPLSYSPGELAREFDAGTITRGTRYAADRRIMNARWSADELLLVAKCIGSGEIYDVEVAFAPRGHHRDLVDARCSCPVGYYCKHTVALLITESRDPSTATPGYPVQAPWRSVLGGLSVDAPAAELALPAGVAPLAIQFHLPKSTRYAQHPAPTITLLTTGKSGSWVKTGISWNATISGSGFTPGIMTRFDPEMFDDRQLRAARAIARAFSTNYQAQNAGAIALGASPPDIWDLLADARDAGIALIPSPSLGVSEIELVKTSGVGLEVKRAERGGGITVTTFVHVNHEAYHGGSVGLIGVPRPHGMYSIADDVMLIGRFESPGDDRGLERLLAAPAMHIPDEEVAEFATEVVPSLPAALPVLIDDDAMVKPEILGPFPLLRVDLSDQGARVQWSAAYDINGRLKPVDGATASLAYRDRAAETAALAGVRDAMQTVAAVCTRWRNQAIHYMQQDLRRTGSKSLVDAITVLSNAPTVPDAARRADVDLLRRTYTYSPIDAAVLCHEVLPLLRENGIRVEVDGDGDRFRAAQGEPDITLTADGVGGNDWFNLHLRVEVDGVVVPMDRLIVELNSSATHMLLDDGTYFPLDHPALQRLTELLDEAKALGEIEGSRVRRDSYNATLWEELLSLGVVDGDLAQWQQRMARLASASPPQHHEPPTALQAQLRDYQVDGYNWLTFLWDNQIGGILADDMGLGKTVQALSLMAYALESDPELRFLVIAPTSVVGNWVREAEKFLPSASAAAVSSPRTDGPIDEQIDDARIVVTSYTLFRLQFAAFDEYDWAAVLFDEAQFIKNHNGKTHQCARRINAGMKVAMTGTPMENSLMELWALLSVGAPGLFPSPRAFTDFFRKPIESGTEPDRLALLRKRIKPVMLRRTKAQVVKDLPPKQEQVLALDLHPRHEKIYQTRLNRERQKVLGLLGDWEKNRFEIFRSLTMLRQLSLHAGLVDEKDADVASAKIDHLAEQLPELIAEGHSALVFSQFTSFLALVRQRLDEMGIAYAYLDGSMTAKARSAAIAEFTEGGVHVFLISLKAGGFGLNLTEADYCFVCDPWWNPAAEAQAVDRAHRIGQTRPVTVYRLVSAGTIEEKVVALQDRKRELFNAVVDDGDLFGAGITEGDIRELLGG
ncbi:MAG TPA: SNF2-related protein [Gordonia sp. (in: high G+C Gram-positive bacteria)]|uniref:DEAD/DEAH box helicase n=1 Tax=unclassified Gordonia (in: high G+C Gram-positive bacteria) TaxID=2657482 RepID=UPI000F96FA00|nr:MULTISPECIES: DEAD/DEAH box helicase [unclassified Gordonia (in: high G+C Gram-positive bacteria)]RUP40390.1 MAG: helicase [Gordonia sp. (in: high G+C Gram-positive bacteria)]HNP57095.1 SNF2-related protein [Gordonia sp. (in: high G+C Gram-positive bacteria)]HRC49368.1 SNF2-related protein [Gordonia sp. (in: high G+C Gram-positive bacteria)]